MCNKKIESATGEDDQTMTTIIEGPGHQEIGVKPKIIEMKTEHHHGIISQI